MRSKTMRQHKDGVMGYLKTFEPRTDIFEFDGRAETELKVPTNPEAYKDLEIENIARQVYGAINREQGDAKSVDKNYIQGIFHNPISDLSEILARQETITELQEDRQLWDQVLNVKRVADRFLYSEDHELNEWEGLSQLDKSCKLVELVSSIGQMKMPKTPRLKRTKELGDTINSDPRFKEAKKFFTQLYIPYELTKTFFENCKALDHSQDVKSKRKFYSGNRMFYEAVQKLLTEDKFKGFVNDEANGLNLNEKVREKVDGLHEAVFGFKGDDSYECRRWIENEGKKYWELLNYCAELLNQAVDCRVPKVELGNLSAELGFYLGAAKLQRFWKAKGIPVTNPILFDKRERRASIINSRNTSLVEKLDATKVVPNDIISDPDNNLFVITGPNNGGKTTYIRQVGQNYWLAHIGMALPAQSAELSFVDGIFTSFNTEDSTKDGTGLYLTELKRISQFTRPKNGGARMSPYSLVFFDEFANGTDHDESVLRTKVVLDHLSQIGVTSYFTTHKHEIAEYVEAGKLPGAINLASEVSMNGQGFITTHRILRNSKEQSYGNFQAEAIGITPESLRSSLESEIASGLYPLEDTRMGGRK